MMNRRWLHASFLRAFPANTPIYEVKARLMLSKSPDGDKARVCPRFCKGIIELHDLSYATATEDGSFDTYQVCFNVGVAHIHLVILAYFAGV